MGVGLHTQQKLQKTVLNTLAHYRDKHAYILIAIIYLFLHRLMDMYLAVLQGCSAFAQTIPHKGV